MFCRLVLILLVCFASLEWSNASAEDAWEVIVPAFERSSIQHVDVLPDGDILVAGHASLTTPNFSGIWLARYSPTGDQVWSQEFIGNAHSRANQILIDDDRIVVAGSHLVRNPFQADSSGFIAELDLDGRIVWETWIEEDRSGVTISKFDVLENGDFLLSGGLYQRDGNIRDAAYFSRITAKGEVKWSFYPPPEDSYFEDLPKPKSVTRDRNGKVVLREAAGPVREQSNGELHLHILRREMMPGDTQIGRCVVVAATGELLDGQTCSRLEEPKLGRDNAIANIELNKVSPGAIFADQIEVSKVDQAGEALWSWQLQSDHKAGITDAVSTADGGVLGVGYMIIKSEPRMHRYDAVAFRLDSEGKEIWSRIYRSDRRDIFTRVVVLDHDNFTLVGHTGAVSQSNWWDPWILRIGADGIVSSQVELTR